MIEQYITIAVAGLHLQGEPLNFQLTERSAVFNKTANTSASYKMYLIGGGKFDKPGLARVGKGVSGYSFPVELWDVPRHLLADFIDLIPAPLGIGSLELDDSSWVKGFICEPCVIDDCTEISESGSWRNYLAQKK